MSRLVAFAILAALASSETPGQFPMSSGSSLKPVSAAALEALLPVVPGWERSDVSSDEGDVMGMSYVNTRGSYSKGEIEVEVQIMDTAGIPALLMPFTMIADGAVNEKTAEGYRVGITMGGQPGWESWENESKQAEIAILVGGRFIVKVTGFDQANTAAVKEVIGAINFAELAALK
jgi:hypothetical protein